MTALKDNGGVVVAEADQGEVIPMILKFDLC